MRKTRFTPATKRAIARAEAFARRHGEIERFPDADLVLGLAASDALLLGVAHPATRADIWPRLGVAPDALHAALEQALTAGIWPPAPTDAPPQDRPVPVDVLLDESAQRAVEYAVAEANRLRHTEIRPEHLLLGALRVGQSRAGEESLGVLVLASFGVTLERVFAAILSSDAEAGTGRYAPRPSPLGEG